MATITAITDDSTLTITDDNGKIVVCENDNVDEGWKTMLDDMVENMPPVCGTFCPEPDTMLGYYLLFTETPFGDLFKVVRVDGDVGEMPFEEGVIY